MNKKIGGKVSPMSRPIEFVDKTKSRPHTICSAGLPSLTAVRTVLEAPHGQGELLPPETVISILNGFAVSLIVDEEKFELLKSNCLESAQFGRDHDTAAGTILTSTHTVFTYLTWGIRHFEKALASFQHSEKKKTEEHLKNSEQMLNSLIDSIQLELNDHPATVLSSTRVPHASFILGLAHVFLALVCKLRKNSSNLVASHLLAAFTVTPNKARQSFIPELWNQLFRPHLSAVDIWYKKEHTNIISCLSRSPFLSVDNRPCSPTIVCNLARPITANAVICRANSLMDLVSGVRFRRKGPIMQNEEDQAKLLDRMNKQVKFLSALYEQSLDEGTLQYARHYQDLIVSYYGRFSDARILGMQKSLQSIKKNMFLQHESAVYQIEQPEVATKVKDPAVPDACIQHTEYEAVDRRTLFERGWTGTNTLQLRRSLIDAIFGTFPNIHKTSKQDRVCDSSSSRPILSLLHLCSKQFPQVAAPRQSTKGQTKNCTPAANYEGTVGIFDGIGKVTTIRDVVNTECSPVPEQQDSLARHTKLTASIRDQSIAAGQINERYPTTHDIESCSMTISYPETQQIPSHRTKPEVQASSGQVNALTSTNHSKRLIDFIQDKNHQSDTGRLALCSGKVENWPTRSCQIAAKEINVEGLKLEERSMRTSNSDSPRQCLTLVDMRSADRELKSATKASRNISHCTSTMALPKTGAVKRKLNKNLKSKGIQIKYCSSLQLQTRPLAGKVSKNQFRESTIIDDAPQIISSSQADASIGKSMHNQLIDLANEMRTVVQATQSGTNTLEGIDRCEEVLLRLSQAWLECKSATLQQQQQGAADNKPESVSGNRNVLKILDGLNDEFLFILANSQLQEAQRLALCLLTASIGPDKPNLKDSALLPYHESYEKKNHNKQTSSQIPSDPSVLQAILHLLQQQGRLREAALLLRLLHPTHYSASCHRLLPLLLELALHNALPRTQRSFDHSPNLCQQRPCDGQLCQRDESLKLRALSLIMMSKLLAALDTPMRIQACKHVVVPNHNALPCLLSSFDCALNIDEKIAAAFILNTCMQADDVYKDHVINHVQLPSLLALLQQTASNGSAFQKTVNFVSELLRTRKASISEILQCMHRDGLLNCMHALMAYLQTASLENQPPAAGLLLQLDLLLGDEHKYSVFREEAMEALLSPFLKECSREATYNAARVLATSGSSQSEQQLEAWLLHKAGLGAMAQENKSRIAVQTYVRSKANRLAQKGQEQKEENENTMASEWDKRVACAIMAQRGGELISNALAKWMRNSESEVRKSCLLVTAWLTFHLRSIDAVGEARKTIDPTKARAKKRMRETLHEQLHEIAAVGSGSAIVERVFAAFALQNLAQHSISRSGSRIRL